MDFDEVIHKRRTIRRFKQRPVPLNIIKKIIDYARKAPQGSNVQALEYIIITNEEIRAKIFPNVRWAGALPLEMREPEEGRRPMAYIVVLLNTTIKNEASTDSGAAIENLLLGATYHGLGCCWMGSIDRKKIHSDLELLPHQKILYVISMGYPDEESQIEPYAGDFKYWRTDDGKMHIPKRSLNDIILKIFE